MIRQNSNVLYDKKVKRSTNYNTDTHQITLFDQRFYKQPNGKYYPSATFVLSYFPKGKFLEDFLKDVGHNAEIILDKAAREGTQVHNACEAIMQGKRVSLFDFDGNAMYSLNVWLMILKFQEFWTTYKPKLIALEYHVHSDEGEYAGTIDIICEINGIVWILDIKSSKAVSDNYYLQLACYKKAWEEHHDLKIDQMGIIWLKSQSRGVDKQGKRMKGKGWEITQSPRSYEKDYELFMCCYKFWEIYNTDKEPVINKYPTVIDGTLLPNDI